MTKYAHSTGGDIFYGGMSRENLEELYARVSEQARNQYTLAYSGAHTDRSKLYHKIEVRVKRPGLSLLTRDELLLERCSLSVARTVVAHALACADSSQHK